MSNGLLAGNNSDRSLDARLASRPQVYARVHAIADMIDQALTEGCTADEAEARAIEQVQQLGRELLCDWAQARQQQSLEQSQKANPSAIRHIKKK